MKAPVAAIREFNQILLQWINAEGVFNLEGQKLAVGAVGLDEEFVVLFEKARLDAEIVETGIIEIAEHGSGRSVLHGVLMLGLLPQRGFSLVAPCAGLATDKGRGRRRAAATQGLRQGEPALVDKHKRQSTDREGRYCRKDR